MYLLCGISYGFCFTDYAHPEAEYTKEAKTMLASIENMKKVHHRSIWKLQNTVQIISQKVRNFSKPIV
jgi:Co/Zn/Cd efflux system component